jgi:uncharacterized membrane protein YphA (DoxX/SURF4 family)
MTKPLLILSWSLRVLVGIGFLMASLGKLTNNPSVITMFEEWGFPNGFHFVIGAMELILAILLLIPKTLKIAIIGLAIIMVGALGTHLLNDPVVELIRPVIFMVLLFFIYYLNFLKNEPANN